MVDPATAGLVGIALVTKVAEQIKAGISYYNSVADLGGQIDAFLWGSHSSIRHRGQLADLERSTDMQICIMITPCGILRSSVDLT